MRQGRGRPSAAAGSRRNETSRGNHNRGTVRRERCKQHRPCMIRPKTRLKEVIPEKCTPACLPCPKYPAFKQQVFDVAPTVFPVCVSPLTQNPEMRGKHEQNTNLYTRHLTHHTSAGTPSLRPHNAQRPGTVSPGRGGATRFRGQDGVPRTAQQQDCTRPCEQIKSYTIPPQPVSNTGITHHTAQRFAYDTGQMNNVPPHTGRPPQQQPWKAG